MGLPRSSFKEALDSIEGLTVYGKRPTNTALTYPCAIYEENGEDVKRADNLPYDITDQYSVTIIEKDPNRPMAKSVRLLFEMCRFNRRFEAENLIHTVYNIYF